MKQKNRKFHFLVCYKVHKAASLLGNILAVTGAIGAGERTVRAGEGTNRVGQDF